MSREAQSGLILASGTTPECPQWPRTATILSRLPSGFLKSRVYAKLLVRLISERYQTFNRQMEEVEPARRMIPKPIK
jgi:hypothetical protein